MQLSNLTQKYLKTLFEYNNGSLIWIKNTNSNRGRAGKVAGCTRHDGYVVIGINKKTYLAHRLIWLYHYGTLPELLDHIDNNPSNNCIENLRIATKKENAQNAKCSNHNSSGYKNVVWSTQKNKWQVKLTLNNKQKHFGYFTDLELADLVAQEARNIYHKNYARSK